ncbi:hypothetical protein M5689_021817 [Euphorbia peplus]|nr:hypothetical protein M5689_021817 [Euphorbia peplus]
MTITTTPSAISDDVVFIDAEEANDFSFWEFVNQSDADSDTESLQSIENGFVSWYTFPPPTRSPPSSLSDLQIQTHELTHPPHALDPANFEDEDEEEEGMHEDDDDDDDDGYGLDDELVPWNMSGKFGRERMRKLGKRFCSKMVNSKRNPYAYVKPGCVHGKHGLGMKA